MDDTIPLSTTDAATPSGHISRVQPSRGPSPRRSSLSGTGLPSGSQACGSRASSKAGSAPRSAASAQRPCSAGAGANRSSCGRKTSGTIIHTLASVTPAPSSGSGRPRSASCASHVPGSRLHDTTEAYRQNRGTTARTVEAVGRATMTPEKAAEVDRAREKALGEKARGASPGMSSRRPSHGGCGRVGPTASVAAVGASTGTRPPPVPRASSGRRLGRA